MGIKLSDGPSGLGAFSKLPWRSAQIVVFAGLIETSGFFSGESEAIGFRRMRPRLANLGTTASAPPPSSAGVGPRGAEEEVASGLMGGSQATMVIIGMLPQDGLTGSAWADWALYLASHCNLQPCRRLGVQASLGFRDPLGLCNSADEATVKRRRAVRSGTAT